MFGWIAIRNLWPKLAAEPELQALIGTTDLKRVRHLATQRLDSIMSNRNEIVHRGRAGFTPGPADVKECSLFFKALLRSIESVVNAHIAAM